jgi:hypothetical protein
MEWSIGMERNNRNIYEICKSVEKIKFLKFSEILPGGNEAIG